jgi:hypothetical protein
MLRLARIPALWIVTFRIAFLKNNPSLCCAMRGTVLLLLTLGICAPLRADPLIHLTLEGRRLGSDAEFSAYLDVDPGDVIEYRLRAEVAPIGTTNVRLDKTVTIEELIPGRDGINSLSVLSLFQSSSDGVQVHFEYPSVLEESWNDWAGTRGGAPTPRAGSIWNNLGDVRPQKYPGVMAAIDPETVFTGSFSVSQVSGPFADLDVAWSIPFGMKINNGITFFPGVAGRGGEDPTDPGVGFVPLTLTSPFDVGEKSITVDYDQPDASPAEVLREQIISGRGGPGIGNGTWTGRGVTSNAAAAENAIQPEAYSVGYADNADLPMGALKTLGEKILDSSEVRVFRLFP